MSERLLSRLPWATAILYFVGLGVGAAFEAANGTLLLGRFEQLGLIVGFGAYAMMGVLIMARRPGHRIGWLFATIGLLAATTFAGNEAAKYGYITNPGELPGAVVAAWYATWSWYPTIGAVLVFTPLLFPTGRVPSPRWRPVAWTASACLIAITVLAALNPALAGEDGLVYGPNPLGLDGVEDVEQSTAGAVLLGIGFACMVAALASLVVRFRRSTGVERQQLKWFTYAGTVLLALIAVEDYIGFPVQSDAIFGLFIGLPPVAAGIAVLRYRLYEIDRVINRTLVYAALTVALALVYVAGVAGLGVLLRPLTGDSQWAVAGSTLVVAALFGPARRRIQDVVDRRFNRARYDAARTVEAFAARLRDQVDLDSLSAELVAVVGHTLEPVQVSLWLRTAGAPPR